jgi:uncharacterized protein YgbK (DUF1537 family)
VTSNLRLAVLADDYTGGADAASMLVRAGARVVQLFGPGSAADRVSRMAPDAVVASLKIRSIEPDLACSILRQTFHALSPLRPRQWQLKYCSTFDSTERGNIGPLCSELLALAGEPFTIAAPALPVNGRTQYRGHLFVHGVLLSESPMRDHPITPMCDSNLVRHLQKQTARRVGLIPLETVRRGPAAVRSCIAELQRHGVEIALADAILDDDLLVLARACRSLRVLTGGSGITAALPSAWIRWTPGAFSVPRNAGGRALLLAGSCSEATLRQISHWQQSGGLLIPVDARALLENPGIESQRLHAAIAAAFNSGTVPLVASSSPPGARTPMAAEAVEKLFAALAARAAAELDVRRIAVAGGETSGAVIDAIGLRAAAVARELSPGVPVLASLDPPGFMLVPKSGNFGPPDFFRLALEIMES